jgi:ABC-2 type transport system permease protein
MKILDIALNDLRRSFRSWFAVGMMLVVPLMITGLIYVAFSSIFAQEGDAPSLPATKVAVVNLDEPTGGQRFGQRLVDFLEDEKLADLVTVTEMADEASARTAVDAQAAGVAVIIPAHFSAAVLAADSRAVDGGVALRLIQDPTLSVGPQLVYDLVSQFADGFSGAKIMVTILDAQLTARGASPDAATLNAAVQKYVAWLTATGQSAPVLDVRAPSAVGKTASASDVLADMMGKTMAGMLVFFTFFSGANGAMSIIYEDEEGTLARQFTTPTPRAVVLGGKFVGVFTLVGVQAVVLMAASALIFRISWGQPVSVLLITLALVAVTSGLGVCIMSFVKSTRQAGPVLGGVLTGMGMAGGLFTSTIPNMPAAFDTFTLFMPQGWAMRAWTLALAGGNVADVLLPTVVMFALGAVFFTIGVLIFRKRFA